MSIPTLILSRQPELDYAQKARLLAAKLKLRAGLVTARAISRNPKITMSFVDGFDPLGVPETYASGAAKIRMPASANINSGHLWPVLRLISDTGTAWINGMDAQAVFEDFSFDDASEEGWTTGRVRTTPGYIVEALEKARREAMFFRNYDGAYANFINAFTLKDRRDDLRQTNFVARIDQRGQIILSGSPVRKVVCEGFYAAALCALMPEFAEYRPDIQFIADMWRRRIDAASTVQFDKLASCADDPEEFCLRARIIADDFCKELDQNLRPFTRQELFALGIGKPGHQNNKAQQRSWFSKNLIELHQQCITRRRFSMQPGNQPSSSFARASSTGRAPQAQSAKPKDFVLPAALQQAHGLKPAKHAELPPPSAPELGEEEGSGSSPVNRRFLVMRPEDEARVDKKDDKDALWVDLGQMMAEDEKPANQLLPARARAGAETDLSWRRDNYLASYRRLRGEHEDVKHVTELFPDRAALEKMWAEIQKTNPNAVRTTRMMAKKFENWLKARTGTRPLHDCEEGMLDLTRLANLVIDPNNDFIHIGDQPDKQMDTCVSLLFDFSGSMSGEPIETAMLLAHGMSGALEKNNIPSEVLGFTTNRKGAMHIVVKDFGDRMRHCGPNFGIAGSGEHMGGTNDTDAVLWATTRLQARPEKRKILVVISDVQPNSSFIHQDFPDLGYEGLLRSVTTHIKEVQGVEISGIGIGRISAQLYYPNGINIYSRRDLGPALVRQMQSILDMPHIQKKRRAVPGATTQPPI